VQVHRRAASSISPIAHSAQTEDEGAEVFAGGEKHDRGCTPSMMRLASLAVSKALRPKGSIRERSASTQVVAC
jgi:hypothetical protein